MFVQKLLHSKFCDTRSISWLGGFNLKVPGVWRHNPWWGAWGPHEALDLGERSPRNIYLLLILQQKNCLLQSWWTFIFGYVSKDSKKHFSTIFFRDFIFIFLEFSECINFFLSKSEHNYIFRLHFLSKNLRPRIKILLSEKIEKKNR